MISEFKKEGKKVFFKKNELHAGKFSDDFMFPNRYRYDMKIEASQSSYADAKTNYDRLVNKNINNLRKLPNRPPSMRYFEEVMLKKDYRQKELQEFKAKGGKIIGTFCLQAPEELIYAAGAIPIRLSCGLINAIPLAEEIMPSNTCPLAKSSVGFPHLKIDTFFNMCDAIMIPTTCDAKKKMADVMSNYSNVWTLELPQNRDHLAAREMWLGQIELFKSKIERLTGKKISRKALKDAHAKLYKRTRLVRQLLEFRKQKNIVITGRDIFLVMQSAFNDDLDRWMMYLEHLIEDLKKSVAENKSVLPPDSLRIMMTGSPTIWPTWKVVDVIEENGAAVIADDSCAGSQYFYNPAEITDYSMKSMMIGIADKYLLPTVCPVYIHNDDRVDRILEISEQFRAEGIIYHVLRLCQLMDFEFNKVNNVLKKKNMPVMKIESEYGEEDIGQLKTRIEAFVEMVKSRNSQ